MSIITNNVLAISAINAPATAVNFKPASEFTYLYTEDKIPVAMTDYKTNVWTSDVFSFDMEEAEKEYRDMMELDESVEVSETAVYQMIDDLIWSYWEDVKSEAETYDQTHDSAYLVVANLGRWNGRFSGYKTYSSLEEVLDILRHRDYEETSIDYEDGEMVMTAIHHDGRDYFNVYELTSKGMDLYDEYGDDFDCEDDIVKKVMEDRTLSVPARCFPILYGFLPDVQI